MGDYRVLITSDIHCTDLEDWYGIDNESRMERWLEAVDTEHARQPFDLILILGDISLDYHRGKTPFDKGYSTAYQFVKMYMSRLPEGVPVLLLPGNHEQFPEDAWERIAGMPRQNHWVWENHTFVMLDGFREKLSKRYILDDPYSPMDIHYIKELLQRYPGNNMWLFAHWFDVKLETEEFRELLAREKRIKGLFCGHSHDHRLIDLGQEYGNRIIAQTGNFSYTMSGAHTGGFWGFRDLVIGESKAVSSYIMADSTVLLDGTERSFFRWVNETAEYSLLQLQE